MLFCFTQLSPACSMRPIASFFYKILSQQQNTFAQTEGQYKVWQLYQEAQQTLTPRSYALRKRGIYQASYWFSLAYHPISFALSIATALLLALIFGSTEWQSLLKQSWSLATLLTYFMIFIGFVLCIFLFMGIEIAKNHYATEVFKHKHTAHPLPTDKAYLLMLSVLSIVVSGIGGACLSYVSSDKSAIHQTTFYIQKDSLHKLYEPKIQDLNQHLNRLQTLQTNTSLRKWGLTEAEQKQLLALQKEKATLQQEYKHNLNELKQQHQQIIVANVDTTSRYVWVTIIVVLIAELLNLRAYSIRYAYWHKVRLEGLSLGYLDLTTTEQETLPLKNNSKNTKTNRAKKMLTTEKNNTLIAKNIPNNQPTIIAQATDERKFFVLPNTEDQPKVVNKATSKNKKNLPELSEADMVLAKKMLATPMSIPKIAQILGTSKQQINKLKKELDKG